MANSTTGGPDFKPPPSQYARRRRRIVFVALGLAVVLVLGTGIVGAAWLVNHCSPGIMRKQGECVGVTDGSFVFAEELRDVQEKIKAENERIQGQRAVTVAVLMPMTAPDDASLSISQIRSHLEGAHIQQLANNARKGAVKIRLVLANHGSREQEWRLAVDQLVGILDDPQPLMAVTGLGLSVKETVSGARALANHDIPMVGSVISADGLNQRATEFGGRIDGLSRVRPSNHVDLEAVADYIRGTDHQKATLVTDSNTDDFYTAGLADDLITHFRQYWENGGKVQDPYDGTQGTGIETQFGTIADRLCGADPPTLVLYAGRAVLLPTFVERLRERSCAKDLPVTVITGSDATDLKVSLSKAESTDAPVSVSYASVDEEKALDNGALNPDRDQFIRFRDSFTSEFPREHLRNGWATMAHDALLTAATAIQKSVGQRNILPVRQNVRGHLYLLNNPARGLTVPGASGTFMIDSVTGDRISQRIPIVQLQQDKSVRVLSVYKPSTDS